MVTGDNIDTARAIAKKCGITTGNDGYLIMDGKEFNKKIVDHNGEVGVVSALHVTINTCYYKYMHGNGHFGSKSSILYSESVLY